MSVAFLFVTAQVLPYWSFASAYGQGEVKAGLYYVETTMDSGYLLQGGIVYWCGPPLFDSLAERCESAIHAQIGRCPVCLSQWHCSPTPRTLNLPPNRTPCLTPPSPPPSPPSHENEGNPPLFDIFLLFKMYYFPHSLCSTSSQGRNYTKHQCDIVSDCCGWDARDGACKSMIGNNICQVF